MSLRTRSTDVSRVAVPKRGVEQVNKDPWQLFGRSPDVGLHPVVGPDLAAEDRVPRARGEPGALGQSEEGGRYDPLLDTDQHHNCQRDERQGELEAPEVQYRTKLLEMEKPRSDKNEYCPKRRLGQVLQQAGRKEEHDDQRCRPLPGRRPGTWLLLTRAPPYGEGWR